MNEFRNPQLRLSMIGVPQSALGRVELSILALVVLMAFAIRVYRLGTFPDTILADEADNAQSALGILAGHPPENGFFGFDWTPQPAMSVYKEAGFIAIFGFTVTAIRLPSALFGALALIPFYFLVRRQISAVASILVTVLLATDVWYLNFSRSGWNNSDVCLYMLTTMLLLMLALQTMAEAGHRPRQAWIYFAAAGFCCALGLYAYPAGRAITLAVAAFFPVACLIWRKHLKLLLLGFFIMFAIEAVAFAPEGSYILKHWDRFNGRASVVAIFNSPAYKSNPFGTMLQQLSNNLRGPWDGRVNNTPQYSPVGEPQLDRFTGALVLLGMGLSLAIRRFRSSPETWLWWLMLLSGWVVTQLITVNTPNGARGIGYMPALVYFAGIALDALIRAVVHVTPPVIGLTVASRLSAGILVAAVLVAGCRNVAHYVAWQSSPSTRQARYLYVTVREFPEWSGEILDRAQHDRGSMNVGQWREAHPIQNVADPYAASP